MIQSFIRAAVLIGFIGGLATGNGSNIVCASEQFAGKAGQLSQAIKEKEQVKSDKSSNTMNFLKRLGQGSCTKDCHEAAPALVCGDTANKDQVKFCESKCDGKWKIPGTGKTFDLKAKCLEDECNRTCFNNQKCSSNKLTTTFCQKNCKTDDKCKKVM